MQKKDEKKLSILNALKEYGQPASSAMIGKLLSLGGINYSERAIRLYLRELDDEGFECQCQCPSCGAGICLCSMAGRRYLSLAWEAAGPILKDGGIYVQLPKQNSAATKAGLQKGDGVVS